jgi:OmpA-OmpF porin, OOP family
VALYLRRQHGRCAKHRGICNRGGINRRGGRQTFRAIKLHGGAFGDDPVFRRGAVCVLGRAMRHDGEALGYLSKAVADKGLMAAYGRDITPEDPSNWELSAAALPELGEARTKLAEAITANRATQPEMAAAAVVAYDKWLVLAYNDSSPGAIAGQREAFYAILTKLSEAQAAATENVPTTTIPAETTSTVLYFPMDSDHLGDTAQAALAQLVNYVKSAGNVTVTINGHADRVGSEQYNLDLSQRRARFVVGALKQAGISEQLLKYFAFGESDPAVPTEDGVAEPRNRRVEIFIE